MTQPYYSGPVSPIVSALSVADLRSRPSNLFQKGFVARITQSSFWDWDGTSTAVDDGTTIIKPSDITHPAPGRWLVVTVSATDITIAANTADAFQVREGGNEYFHVDTRTGAQVISIGEKSAGSVGITQVSINLPAVQVNAFRVRVSSNDYLNLTTDSSTPASQWVYGSATVDTYHRFECPTNGGNAFVVRQRGSNNFFKCDMSFGVIELGNAVNNPNITCFGTGSVRLAGVGGRIGLYSVTPVLQHSTTGQTAGFTAGAGAAMLVDSTFTGGVGATAYTHGDVVRCLKNLGAMAA